MVLPGDTVMLQFPLPVPVVKPPLLSRVSVQSPLAATVPLTAVPPPQMVISSLVMAAVGLGLTVMVTLAHADGSHGEDSYRA